MKTFIDRSTALLWVAAIGTIIAAGCQAPPPEGGANAAMSAKQKAILKENKKQDE